MSIPLLSCSHLAMYQASLYLKTNQPVCLFTHSKGTKIGPSCQELRGLSKCPQTLKHPVYRCPLHSTQLPVSSSRLLSCDTHNDDQLASEMCRWSIFSVHYGPSGFIYCSRENDRQTFHNCSRSQSSIPNCKEASWGARDTLWTGAHFSKKLIHVSCFFHKSHLASVN